MRNRLFSVILAVVGALLIAGAAAAHGNAGLLHGAFTGSTGVHTESSPSAEPSESPEANDDQGDQGDQNDDGENNTNQDGGGHDGGGDGSGDGHDG